MMHAAGAKTAADIAAADDMQIITLNFNGIDGDLISLLTWLDLHSVDVLCLQESKLAPGSIQATPEAFLRRIYTAHFSTPERKRRANQLADPLLLPEDHHIASRDRSA